MLKVGLTGGLATGKTTVGQWLAEMGCHLIRYDELGHQVLQPDGEAYAGVVDAFGPEILNPDGTIDRSALGRRVFANPAELDRLSALVHPPAHARAKALTEQFAAADPRGIVVVEAAILIETGSYSAYDRLIVVTCQPEQQLERAMTRGLTRQQAQDRIDRQMPLKQKVSYADFVIDTSGSLDAARQRTEKVYQELRGVSMEQG